MCGRFTLRTSPAEVVDFFGLADLSPTECAALQAPRANICPTELVAAVRQTDAGRELAFFRWGLIPSWAPDPKIAASLINARSETAATKPAFRTAFRRRRCLVPADGFYEWEKAGRKRIPYHIAPRSGGLVAMAGLWETWHDPEDVRVETCTLLTTAASEAIQPLHDRMPVFLDPAVFDVWLDPEVQDPERLTPLLLPATLALTITPADPALFARPAAAKPAGPYQRRLFDDLAP